MALDLANQDRARYGLSRLRPNALLSRAAQMHAEDMLRRNYFSHYSPEGKAASERFAMVGGRGGAAENLLMLKDSSLVGAKIGYDRLAFFQRGWMGSPGHRKNLLDRRYGQFGFGIAKSGSRIYAVQLFSFSN
ncbi:CAP domain-containing protein [Altericista sp. CCNU0014]|uniref:CAP domain-containing protein n=1 Tax=Altericista sp. CCNU0014 TaxID=3082949 RepID=UPI0038504E1F